MYNVPRFEYSDSRILTDNWWPSTRPHGLTTQKTTIAVCGTETKIRGSNKQVYCCLYVSSRARMSVFHKSPQDVRTDLRIQRLENGCQQLLRDASTNSVGDKLWPTVNSPYKPGSRQSPRPFNLVPGPGNFRQTICLQEGNTKFNTHYRLNERII